MDVVEEDEEENHIKTDEVVDNNIKFLRKDNLAGNSTKNINKKMQIEQSLRKVKSMDVNYIAISN